MKTGSHARRGPSDDIPVRPSSGARRRPVPLPEGHRVGEAIPALFEVVQRGFAPWKKTLAEHWPGIVGPKFRAHLRPGRYEARAGRRLVVFVDHPVFLYEARMELRDLMRRIREAVPGTPIERVDFALDPDRGDAHEE